MTDSDGKIDCEFDGSRSSGNVARFFWKIILSGGEEYRWDTTDAKSTISPNCGFWSDASEVKILESFTVTVSLTLRPPSGSDSAAGTKTVTVYPGGNCGFSHQ